MSAFLIHIDSDHPDAEHIVRLAAEKMACELDWGQYTTDIDVERTGEHATYLAGWALVPSAEES